MDIVGIHLTVCREVPLSSEPSEVVCSMNRKRTQHRTLVWYCLPYRAFCVKPKLPESSRFDLARQRFAVRPKTCICETCSTWKSQDSPQAALLGGIQLLFQGHRQRPGFSPIQEHRAFVRCQQVNFNVKPNVGILNSPIHRVTRNCYLPSDFWIAVATNLDVRPKIGEPSYLPIPPFFPQPICYQKSDNVPPQSGSWFCFTYAMFQTGVLLGPLFLAIRPRSPLFCKKGHISSTTFRSKNSSNAMPVPTCHLVGVGLCLIIMYDVNWLSYED